MEKYRIKIVKLNQEAGSLQPIPGYVGEQEIFEAGVSSDGTIELLQHLYDLKEKEKDEGVKCRVDD